jgi:peptide chain release factor subunit 1
MKDYELSAIIDSLEEKRGGGTWHISLYIRPDKSLQSVQNRIVQEISEAESIKSDDTRSRVQSSLGKIKDALSEYRQTPDNGMAVFASPQDVHVLDDLPFECPENRYHCGKEYILDPLTAGFDTGGSFGLIVIERGRGAVAVLESGRLTNVLEKESHVMGKQKAGGQSQKRFERLREQQKHEFYKSIQESAYATFKPYDLDGVVVGGTLSSAKEFEDGYVNHEWNIIGTYSVDHGDEQGLEELVTRAESALLEEERKDEREAVDRFLKGLREGDAEYGRERVVTAIEQGRVETLLLSSNLDVSDIRALSSDAENYGSNVVVVTPDYEDAQMFEQLGGIGAVLRW